MTRSGPNDDERVFSRALFAVLLSAYGWAILSGVLRFEVWSQIVDHARIPPWEVDFRTDAHGLRYLLMYPILALGEATRIDIDRWFSLLVGVLLVGTALLNEFALRRAFPDRPARSRLVAIAAFWMLLSTLMNGRLAFAFFGVSLLIVAFQRWRPDERSWSRMASTLALVPLALFACSVSSGTFVMAALAAAAWSANALWVSRGRLSRPGWVLPGGTMLLMAVLAPLLALFVTKNVDFYDGGWVGAVKLLGHGPGSYLLALGRPLAVVAFFAYAATGTWIAARIAHREPPLTPFVATVWSAGVLGTFGYSTLSMALPGLIGLLYVALIEGPLSFARRMMGPASSNLDAREARATFGGPLVRNAGSALLLFVFLVLGASGALRFDLRWEIAVHSRGAGLSGVGQQEGLASLLLAPAYALAAMSGIPPTAAVNGLLTLLVVGTGAFLYAAARALFPQARNIGLLAVFIAIAAVIAFGATSRLVTALFGAAAAIFGIARMGGGTGDARSLRVAWAALVVGLVFSAVRPGILAGVLLGTAASAAAHILLVGRRPSPRRLAIAACLAVCSLVAAAAALGGWLRQDSFVGGLWGAVRALAGPPLPRLALVVFTGAIAAGLLLVLLTLALAVLVARARPAMAPPFLFALAALALWLAGYATLKMGIASAALALFVVVATGPPWRAPADGPAHSGPI